MSKILRKTFANRSKRVGTLRIGTWTSKAAKSLLSIFADPVTALSSRQRMYSSSFSAKPRATAASWKVVYTRPSTKIITFMFFLNFVKKLKKTYIAWGHQKRWDLLTPGEGGGGRIVQCLMVMQVGFGQHVVLPHPLCVSCAGSKHQWLACRRNPWAGHHRAPPWLLGHSGSEWSRQSKCSCRWSQQLGCRSVVIT